MKVYALITLVAATLVPACSWFQTRETTSEKPLPDAPQMGNPLLVGKKDIDAVNMNVATEKELEAIDNGAEGEVIFSDPDDLEGSEKSINALFENRRQGNSWFEDYNRALRFSRREGRPMLLWFHDSTTSPKSNTLGQHVLYTNRFDAWCKDRVTRVLLDAGEGANVPNAPKPKYSLSEIRKMGQRFGVKRNPAVVVISMSGDTEVVFDGVEDGNWGYYESQIRQAIERAEKKYEQYKDKLRDRGYRDWTIARKKKPLFARYVRYDQQTERVYLKETGGRIGSVRVANLSEEDRTYIREKMDAVQAKKQRL